MSKKEKKDKGRVAAHFIGGANPAYWSYSSRDRKKVLIHAIGGKEDFEE